MISIVLVTYNRLHLLKQCVEKVVMRTSLDTKEVIFWNNCSTDETAEYLGTLKDERFRVINHHTNIGTNAYARVFRLAKEPYLIELDDDILEAPQDWDRTLLSSLKQGKEIGFLAAHVVNDGKSLASQIIYHRDRHLYTRREINGVRILDGPMAGWCSITSRKLYDKVGGFKENKRFKFWHADGVYVKALRRAGYICAILENLKVFHASGPAYSSDPQLEKAKSDFYTWRDRRVARRTKIKRIFEKIPPIRVLNRKLHLYQAPGVQ